MTPDEFDAVFDQFRASAFRLETLQSYAVSSEDASLRAFREGLPRPERSVRTSPWLRRIALTTAAGKRWSRVHVIEEPLSWYIEWELLAYVESAAVGEEIRLADRGQHPELGPLREDFWLFDAELGDQAFAVRMRYDQPGSVEGYDLVRDPATLDEYRRARDLAWACSVSLNEYLARRARSRAA